MRKKLLEKLKGKAALLTPSQVKHAMIEVQAVHNCPYCKELLRRIKEHRAMNHLNDKEINAIFDFMKRDMEKGHKD